MLHLTHVAYPMSYYQNHRSPFHHMHLTRPRRCISGPEPDTRAYWCRKFGDDWVLLNWNPGQNNFMPLILSIQGRVMTHELNCGQYGNFATKQHPDEETRYSLHLSCSDWPERMTAFRDAIYYLREVVECSELPPDLDSLLQYTRPLRRWEVKLSCPVFVSIQLYNCASF